MSECTAHRRRGKESRRGMKSGKDDKLVVRAGGIGNDVIHLRSSWLEGGGHLDLCSECERERNRDSNREKYEV